MIYRHQRWVSPDCGEYFDKDTWTGFAYPDRHNKIKHQFVGTYRTLESCSTTALRLLAKKKWQNADYECGLNCRRKDGGALGGINICKKTVEP